MASTERMRTRWLVCCRRATRSDADRNGGTYFILELSFGVSDHFVHILLGVNVERGITNRRCDALFS